MGTLPIMISIDINPLRAMFVSPSEIHINRKQMYEKPFPVGN